MLVSLPRRPFGVFGRLGWGVADQAVSSLTNFALGIVLARSLGAEGFGSFSLAYVTFGFVICAARGLATDPLLVRFSGPSSSSWRQAVAAATATSAILGVAAGAACIVFGLFLPAQTRGAFVALGVGLPALLLQDSWRFAFFSVGRPVKALINDVVWGVSLIAALVGLLLTDHASVVTCVLAFGATAALAACVGLLQSRIMPRPRLVRPWIFDHKALGGRYLVENLSVGGARQIRMFAVGAFAGLAAVGNTRGAEILMGPFLVILMGAAQVAVPEASHVIKRAPARLLRFCFGLGAVVATAAAVWGVALLMLLPTSVGDWLLGSLWLPASALLPPIIVQLVMAGFEIAASAGVRALGAAPRSLTAQLVQATLYAAGGTVGALIDGARGSCWGVAVATAIGAGVWWIQLRRALEDFLAASPGSEMQPDSADRITS